ncbi:hypothetical protein [Clostridium polynesiense]|uniref:hypothetical protein n=1 Tax=Clostridium polynesiense TaxID=1325933 RepID=UPI00058DC53A|nr:hypothetical protein [Clostridium polynesiense]
MIKGFRDLNKDDIREVQLYLNSLEKNDKSVSQIKEEFNTKIYKYRSISRFELIFCIITIMKEISSFLYMKVLSVLRKSREVEMNSIVIITSMVFLFLDSFYFTLGDIFIFGDIIGIRQVLNISKASSVFSLY